MTDLNRLKQEIADAATAYYAGSPIMTDDAFDTLVDSARQLAEQEGTVLELPVGAPATGTKSRHAYPVLSLDKATTADELMGFFGKFTDTVEDWLLVEPKLDGASLVLYYVGGKLQRAVTRGDGYVGEDVTANALYIKGVKSHISSHLPLVVRGEAVIFKQDFADMVAGGADYKSARNLAAGTLRMDDPRECKRRKVRFIAFDVMNLERYHDRVGFPLDTLERAGFRTAIDLMMNTGDPGDPGDWPIDRLNVHNMTTEATADMITELAKVRDQMPVECDGFVIKAQTPYIREGMGSTGHHPRWAIALKFPGKAQETRIREIEFSVGRSGAITPVALIDPVEISGVTIGRVSLHSVGHMLNELNTGPGDRVLVQRAGDIIPQVVEVLERNCDNPADEIPLACPVCGGDVGDGRSSEALYCIGPDCPEKIKQRILQFVGKDGLNVKYFGEQAAAVLVDEGLRNPYECLSGEWLELLRIRLGKIIDHVDGQVDCMKQDGVPLHRLVAAIGLEHVGKGTARRLSTLFPDLGELMGSAMSGSLWTTVQASGIRAIREGVDNIAQQFGTEAVLELTPFLELIDFKADSTFYKGDDPSDKESGPLDGLNVCVTGKLSSPRKEIHARIEAAGGTPVSSVSKTTDILVVGEKAGSKLAKAEKRGIRIMAEAELEELAPLG